MSLTILDEIAGKTRQRVEQAKKVTPLEQLREQALAKIAVADLQPAPLTAHCSLLTPQPPVPAFENALRQPELSFICEVKKASPSKGIIAEDFPYLHIAREYEAAGAAAISVLTEPDYFLGSDQYLREIAGAVSIPTLRKDFTIDPYQIYEAKLLGADAILLICALLDTASIAAYIGIAAELGMSALVEIHTQAEAERAVQAGARIIGINNRNLATFNVDINASAVLRNCIPAGILTVAESGIQTPEDVRVMRKLEFDAVLIGESLMRKTHKKQFLTELKNTLTEDL